MLPLSHVEVFSHSNFSSTIVKCSFTSSIPHMTRNTDTHRVGQFLLSKLGTKTRTRSGTGQANCLELELEHKFTAWNSYTLFTRDA